MAPKSLLLIIFAVDICSRFASAFFFGGSGGGGGGCACPPPPVCAQPPPQAVCPAAPSCIPQSNCGGGGYNDGGISGGNYGGSNYLGGGGGSYASSPISFNQQSKQSYIGSARGGYASGGAQYAEGPHGGGLNLAPAVGAQPPPQPLPQPHSAPYNAGPSHQPITQVPPSSYSDGQGHAAGQRLQEVEDDLDEKMMAEVKAEDELIDETLANAESALSASERERLHLANEKNEIRESIDVSKLNLTKSADCNSEDLRKILKQNMDDDLNTSKRMIQLTAEAKFGGRFDVICSNNDFSYVTNTELYCQETKQTISCYAYRQL